MRRIWREIPGYKNYMVILDKNGVIKNIKGIL